MVWFADRCNRKHLRISGVDLAWEGSCTLWAEGVITYNSLGNTLEKGSQSRHGWRNALRITELAQSKGVLWLKESQLLHMQDSDAWLLTELDLAEVQPDAFSWSNTANSFRYNSGWTCALNLMDEARTPKNPTEIHRGIAVSPTLIQLQTRSPR